MRRPRCKVNVGKVLGNTIIRKDEWAEGSVAIGQPGHRICPGSTTSPN